MLINHPQVWKLLHSPRYPRKNVQRRPAEFAESETSRVIKVPTGGLSGWSGAALDDWHSSRAFILSCEFFCCTVWKVKSTLPRIHCTCLEIGINSGEIFVVKERSYSWCYFREVAETVSGGKLPRWSRENCGGGGNFSFEKDSFDTLFLTSKHPIVSLTPGSLY